MDALRIVVADDHVLVRRGLVSLLESQPGWKVVGQAATGREAVELTRSLKPGVVVLDINMPQLNGVEAARLVSANNPPPEILILSAYDSDEQEYAAIRAGARGFMLKSDTGRDLVAAVESLRRHRPFFTGNVSRMLIEGFLSGNGRHSEEPAASRLTPREREVLLLLAEGGSNKTVAGALDISVKTAEAHRASIMRKLDLRSVSDLVRYAVRNGIVSA